MLWPEGQTVIEEARQMTLIVLLSVAMVVWGFWMWNDTYRASLDGGIEEALERKRCERRR